MKLPLHVDWDGTGGHRGNPARPVLALLHGFAGDGTAWAPVRDGLRSLGPTLAIDLIGHGQSPAPDDPRRYRMEACLDDLEAVLKRLGIPAAWWVGYSMGGRTALQLAVHKPMGDHHVDGDAERRFHAIDHHADRITDQQ